MTFNYPNGNPYLYHAPNKPKAQVTTGLVRDKNKKKPNLVAKTKKTETSTNNSSTEFGNRGMKFEEAINLSNEYYLNCQKAVVHKKPTPLQIVKVDYPKRSKAVIKEAYFSQASTTDYNGVYRGYYLDFEAKVTKNKTSFPLNNFHSHQINHMQQCAKQGGICFVLLWFSSFRQCYLMGIDYLARCWDNQKSHGKKSISLKDIQKHSYLVPTKIAPRIDYLPAVDHYIESIKESNYE